MNMMNNLTPPEEKQLQSLLNNQRRDIRSLNITSNLFLVFAGLLLIGTAFYLLKNLTDSAAYFVGLPNFVGGMLLIVAYVLLSRRVIQLKQLNSLLSKLSEMKVAA
jgi:hypothetical protein